VDRAAARRPCCVKETRLLSRELDDLIQRAQRTREGRARIIVEACLERLPHYQGLPDAMHAEIHDSILHHLTLFYAVTLKTGRDLTDEDLAYSRALARVRAAQGVPLGEFLTFFLVGLTRTWEDLIESASEDPNLRAQLLDRVTPVISNQTMLMTALTEAYVEERERLSRFREQDIDDFVQLLLAENAVGSVLETRALTLGIPLAPARTVAIFAPLASREDESGGITAEEVRRGLIARLPDAEIWVGRAREGFVALLPDDVDDKPLAATAESLFGLGSRVGVGHAGREIEGLRRSAREALRALEIGMSQGNRKPVVTYASVAVLDLVGIDTARAEDFMREVLGPLIAPNVSANYLATLRQLSDHNFSLKLAAAELSVHPHTLSYRVKQIRRRFGFDLEDPETRLRIQLALRILDGRRGAGAARHADGASD
jgi:sugar diacid utilization regulator